MSECKADAGWPPLLLKQAVGPLEYNQFRTKKNDGPLYPLRGHHTRTLAGIFGDIGSYSSCLGTRRSYRPRGISRAIETGSAGASECAFIRPEHSMAHYRSERLVRNHGPDQSLRRRRLR